MLENAAESPASSARFVGQPLCLPKRWQKKIPPQTRQDFTRNFDFYQNQKNCDYKTLATKNDFAKRTRTKILKNLT
jgi:hypothetical protein